MTNKPQTFRDFVKQIIAEHGIENIKKTLERQEGVSNEEFFGKEKAKIIEEAVRKHRCMESLNMFDDGMK